MRRAAAVMGVALVLAGCAAGRDTTPATTQAPAAATSAAPAPATSSVPDPELDGPLLAAADRGDTAAVRDLLARGARVSARDQTGATALVRAAYGNHVEVAGVLIAAGADVNLADTTRQSAYLIATSEVGDDPRLLELALAGGADVNAKDSYNGTGLIRAAERGAPADRRAAPWRRHRSRPRQPGHHDLRLRGALGRQRTAH